MSGQPDEQGGGERIPHVVDWGWFTNLPIPNRDAIGNRDWKMQLLFYADQTVRFEHTCDRGERGVIICAPALSEDHVVTPFPEGYASATTTVTPSILCPDCGVHGFITDGQWRAA